jgi:S1-C subfamily serine protease
MQYIARLNYSHTHFFIPSNRAGLRSGDVITKINGTNISTSKEVFDQVKKGETLNMEVQRGSKTVHVAVQPQVVG